MTFPLPGNENPSDLLSYINLKLAALGQPPVSDGSGGLLDVAQPLLRNYREKSRLLTHYLCPVDWRIQQFLDDYFEADPVTEPVPLVSDTFVLDRPGLARALSLPPQEDLFESDIVRTYRVAQGVLHNPKSDRRTTAGVFHVAEGGLPIPHDKKAVPKAVFRNLLAEAFRAPDSLLELPFTAGRADRARLWVSLLMRPLVSPAVPGHRPAKTMEIRFFAPGNLVGNLDFVESIFGNGGDPALPENDAALDVDTWTGHTGCVVLAPHLVRLTKKALGLPSWDTATPRQRRDGMCWKNESELYNEGQAFKVTARDTRGVMVTVIADNYFGYCKKEVKTQIGYAANLFGGVEEEHSGGALAFASYDEGYSFHQEERVLPQNGATFRDVPALLGEWIDLRPEGHGVDRRFPDIFYVPENARVDLIAGTVSWSDAGGARTIKLLAGAAYLYPNGHRVTLEKQPGGQGWHLVGVSPEGALCHKPSTVSGGGKSEISKSILDAMVQGPVFVADFQKDFDEVARILAMNFGHRFKDPKVMKRPSRPVLSPQRSLGSVIKLFTSAEEYTDEFNRWLRGLSHHIVDLIFVVKRFYRPEWGEGWRSHFSVDMINGAPGHELKLDGRRLTAQYLRIGFDRDGSRRILRVRQDFAAAKKVQVEDDITASTVVPVKGLSGLPLGENAFSVKFVQNCERRLFQRPDDAIHRGYDKQAEGDIATAGVFLSNFEPLSRETAREIVEDAMGFEQYSTPMQNLFRRFLAAESPRFIVSSAHPRIFEGKPSKNPRYLQDRPDLADPRATLLAEMGARLFRRIPWNKPVLTPVSAVLAGRRNNPPDVETGAPPLAVFNPIHYQELPELFMDFVSSLTGKSPSTTGFGSEGALTKGPFNALWPTADLNNALVSFILTGGHGFTTAAGHIGPHYRVDHDISLLVPEIWCRLSPAERNPAELIAQGYLEKVEDFEHNGRRVPAGRLGYRITQKFVRWFLGRVFNNPNVVFSEEMLKPELQDKEMFVRGVEEIAAAHKRVALTYFEDGSAEAACPPLLALLHIMAHGHFEGKDLSHPEVRGLFTRDSLLASDWYRRRLETQAERDRVLWRRHVAALEEASADPIRSETVGRSVLKEKLARARQELKRVESPDYANGLQGALGADPLDATAPQRDNQSARAWADKTRNSMVSG